MPLRRQIRLRNRLPNRFAAAFLILMTMGCANSVAAQLTIVYDSGQTTSIAQYLKAINLPGAQPTGIPVVPDPLPPAMTFPIQSPSLVGGPLPRTGRLDHRLMLANPVFLIGSDPFSRHWLSIHQAHLTRLGAAGLVVEVPNLRIFQALQSLVPNLPLAPASGEDLARALKLTHYPVLISPTGGISQ